MGVQAGRVGGLVEEGRGVVGLGVRLMMIGEGVADGMEVTPAHEVGAAGVVRGLGEMDFSRSASFVSRNIELKLVIWRPVAISSRTWWCVSMGKFGY